MELFWSVATMVSVPLGLLIRCRPRSLPGVRPRPSSRVTETGLDMVRLRRSRGVFGENLSGERTGGQATGRGMRRSARSDQGGGRLRGVEHTMRPALATGRGGESGLAADEALVEA